MTTSEGELGEDPQLLRADTTSRPLVVIPRHRHTKLELMVAVATIIGITITCASEVTSQTGQQPLEIRLQDPRLCDLTPTAEHG